MKLLVAPELPSLARVPGADPHGADGESGSAPGRPTLTVGAVQTRWHTDPDEHAHHSVSGWALGDSGLLVSSDHERDFRAVHHLALDGTWRVLVEADDHDLDLKVSRDGNAFVVAHHVDAQEALQALGPGDRLASVAGALELPPQSKVSLVAELPGVPQDLPR